MIVCQECGNAAPSPDGFCSSCGALLEWAGQPVETPAPVLVNAGPAAVKPDEEAVRPTPVPLAHGEAWDGLFCSSCGARNADGRSFCRLCGASLDVTVAAPARRRWWQPLVPRRRKPQRAGDRPRGFRRHGQPTPPSRDGRGLRLPSRLPSRLPLSRVAPVLVVLGLVGIGLGPARMWLTQKADTLVGGAKQHVTRSFEPVTPVRSSATSAAKGHPATAAIDGVRDTWWQSRGHADGIGEAVTVRFADPTDIDAIGLLSGVPGDKFRVEARPRTLTITVDGRPAGQVSFADKADFQTATVHLKHVSAVTMVVTASYPGQGGTAVAVRELQFSQLR